MKIGLLPLYIALYDEKVPKLRLRLEAFYQELCGLIAKEGIEVVPFAFCRVKKEFEAAVAAFEREKADAIVTVHMAYSPSLESADALGKTKLPVIVFDTTPVRDFSDRQSPEEILYCHGIHGVMDLCNLLRRNGKDFAICAGYYRDSSVLKKLFGYIKAAAAANALRGSAVGSVGGSFDGMGDFLVSDAQMREAFDIKVVHADPGEIRALSDRVTEEEIQTEIAKIRALGGELSAIPQQTYHCSAKAGLTLCKWIELHQLRAFTINFRKVSKAGLDTMPFLEAGRAMDRGIGYAGEGDVLTAAFTGALLSSYPQTSFVEIFCPDWENDALFLSHMGEMNFRVADGPPELFEKEFVYGDALHPVAGTGAFRAGEAVFVNIFPTSRDFCLLLSSVSMLKEGTRNFAGNIRGWMKPSAPVSEFLEKLSLAGATHHSILVYDATVRELEFFARCLGLAPVIIP